jgi:tRNA(Ile)-lysidine synthase
VTTGFCAVSDGEVFAQSIISSFLPNLPARIGVAISGGSDSTALLHLCHVLSPHLGWQVQAVTVDHGLRPESATEAKAVGAFCAALGVGHTTLLWTGPNPAGNLMDQARRARLALISDWAANRGIGHVCLGHTADDQAESFLMNLARHSGLDGLSGLRTTWLEQGVQWHRPLLSQPRRALRAYLRSHSVDWADDPSNQNDRFTRIKARRAMQALAPLGITVETLTQTVQNLASAREALLRATARVAEAEVTQEAGGLRLCQTTLQSLDADIRRRLLIAMMGWINGAVYPPRQMQMAQLDTALAGAGSATLGGCRFRLRAGFVRLTREPRAVQGAVPLGQIWDGRWHVEGPMTPGLTVGALGARGLLACKDWRETGFSRDQLLVSPAVWQADHLIAAPLAGNAGPYRADLPQPFNRFVLSH